MPSLPAFRWKDATRRLRTIDSRHWAAAGVLAGIAVAMAGLVVVWPGRPSAPSHALSKARPSLASPDLRLTPRRPGLFPGTTMLADVKITSPRYATPGGRATGQVPGTWWGVPSVLPVVSVRRGWVQVQLAQRPNGSEAWIPASDVTLSSTPYRIVINLATTRLALYDEGHQVFSAPAGVGTVSDPTPTGHYFVAFTESPPQPNRGYGPFILVTSAHSPNIGDWAGSGDAVIGIHGPLGDDSLIGTTGARISHGCIRLHLSALLKLRNVTPGTPVDIIR
jgi:lipoprotein-anchoring transpeptidase ErfK/SrfK